MKKLQRTNTQGDKVRHHLAAAASQQAGAIIGIVIVVEKDGTIRATSTSQDRKDQHAAESLMDAAVRGMQHLVHGSTGSKA